MKTAEQLREERRLRHSYERNDIPWYIICEKTGKEIYIGESEPRRRRQPGDDDE